MVRGYTRGVIYKSCSYFWNFKYQISLSISINQYIYVALSVFFFKTYIYFFCWQPLLLSANSGCQPLIVGKKFRLSYCLPQQKWLFTFEICRPHKVTFLQPCPWPLFYQNIQIRCQTTFFVNQFKSSKRNHNHTWYHTESKKDRTILIKK